MRFDLGVVVRELLVPIFSRFSRLTTTPSPQSHQSRSARPTDSPDSGRVESVAPGLRGHRRRRAPGSHVGHPAVKFCGNLRVSAALDTVHGSSCAVRRSNFRYIAFHNLDNGYSAEEEQLVTSLKYNLNC